MSDTSPCPTCGHHPDDLEQWKNYARKHERIWKKLRTLVSTLEAELAESRKPDGGSRMNRSEELQRDLVATANNTATG